MYENEIFLMGLSLQEQLLKSNKQKKNVQLMMKVAIWNFFIFFHEVKQEKKKRKFHDQATFIKKSELCTINPSRYNLII